MKKQALPGDSTRKQMLSLTRRYLPVWLSLIIGTGLTAIAAILMWKWQVAIAQAKWEQRTQDLASALQQNIDEYVQVTRALGAFYTASDRMNAQDFREFSQPFLQLYPGIYGMAWARRVLEKDRQTYEQAMQVSGFHNFSIKERDAKRNLVPAKQRQEYLPITYGEPLSTYAPVIGSDLKYNDKLPLAIAKARDTGEMVATERLVLLRVNQAGFAILWPVYLQNSPTRTRSDKRRSFLGIAYTAYRLSNLVREAIKGLDLQKMDFYLIDSQATVDNRFLFFYNSSTGKLLEENPRETLLPTPENFLCRQGGCTRILTVVDRNWLLLVRPTEDFTQIHWPTGVTLGIGLILTIMLANYLWISIRRTEDLRAALEQLQLTQAQLVQSEKMSSLGQLVAGVAHEINNPVSFIYGNLNYAKQYVDDLLELLQLYALEYPHPSQKIEDLVAEIDIDFLQEDLTKILKSMEGGADRIQKIVQSLRNFSRLDESDFKLADIHEGLDNTLLILLPRLKEDNSHTAIEIIKKYGNLPQIECYPGELNQVFMNILNNAIDALREASKFSSLTDDENIVEIPTIQITTEVIDKENDNDKQWVLIRIQDNGVGMNKDGIDKIFNPFFTTKPVGKGTGLGLYISYQIVVEKHGGDLKCFSEPGKGTELTIEIPFHQG